MRFRYFLIPLIIAWLFSTAMTKAHGGGDLIAGPEEVGPYLVSVWLNPSDPRANETIHYTIGLASPVDRQPILDAQIMVEMRSERNDAPAAAAPATTDQSINKLFYETDMMIEETGLYETRFIISGPAGQGELMVPVQIDRPPLIDWKYLAFAGLAVITLAGWWRSRRQKKQVGQNQVS